MKFGTELKLFPDHLYRVSKKPLAKHHSKVNQYFNILDNMVKEIHSLDEFESEIKGPGLVVVDFFTTWCGPCKQIAPFIESLAEKFPEVKFIKVDIEKHDDIAGPRSISSIPTFHFIVKGNMVDEVKGADARSVEEKVQQYKVDVNPFKGSGNRLSSDPIDPNVPALSAREARLKAFASLEGEHKRSSAASTPPVQGDDEDEAALSKALALSMAGENKSTTKPASATQSSVVQKQDDADFEAAAAEFDAEGTTLQHFQETPGQDWEEEMVPVPVNEELLAQLLDMGFPDVRARKSLVHGGSLDGAMGWLAEHQDDADIDQPYMVRKIDTLPKPPLTEEEKSARMQAIKDKVKDRKAERARQEKAEEIRREKERRERGQKIDETLEERQRLQRKRDADRIKREKDDTVRERQRLRAEIAADKERRKANKGVLPSVLGVDGYNPSIIQYDVPVSAAPAVAHTDSGSVPAKRASEASPSPAPAASAAVASKVPPTKKSSMAPNSSASGSAAASPDQRVESAIQTLMRYRTGGDGGQALKLLLTFVRNVADNPTELKYQSISTESNAFKTKLAPLVGSLTLLKAVGFQKGEGADEGKLKFEGDATSPLLKDTVQKLINAEALYKQQNAL